MCNTIRNYTLTCVYILVHQTTLNFRILDKNPTCCRLSQESRIFLYFSFFGRINHCLSLRNQVGFILKSRSSTTEKRTSTNTTLDVTDFALWNQGTARETRRRAFLAPAAWEVKCIHLLSKGYLWICWLIVSQSTAVSSASSVWRLSSP